MGLSPLSNDDKLRVNIHIGKVISAFLWVVRKKISLPHETYNQTVSFVYFFL